MFRWTVLALAGCGVSWETSEIDAGRLLQLSAVTNTAGVVDVVIHAEEDETAMLITASVPEDRLVFVHHVDAPGGERRFDASEFWELDTNRVYAAFSASTVSLNWPFDADAPTLERGRWQVSVRSDASGTPLNLSVLTKRDGDFTAGALTVNVRLADAVAADADLMAGVNAALDLWVAEIYAAFDLDVTLQVSTVELPERIEAPGRGDAELYEQLTADSAPGELNLVITDRVSDNNLVLGIAGGIPGALVPGRSSAVALSAVSASEAAGRDRAFSATEVELFAETMAHEVGHYLGLFHPAEIPVTGFVPPAWDALADTDQCMDFDVCMAVLGANLMFPSPVCEDPSALFCSDFVEQRSLSGLQIALAQRYTGVR